MLKLVRHVTLRQLQVFEAVARLRNFSRAGEELFLTQSTVSTQIKNLNDAVGLPLLEQVGKEIHLTEAGNILHKACRDVFNTLDNADMAVADLKGMKRGTLKLAAITTAKYFAPEALGHFSQLYPEIELSLTIQNRNTILQRLKNNADDLYILGHNPPLEMDIYSQVFAPNPLYVMASVDHPLAKRATQLSLKELAEQPLIMREVGSGIRSTVEALFEAHELKPNIRMIFDNNEAIKHAIIGQLGISVLSLHSILLEGKNGPLAIVDTEHFPINRSWHVVYPKGKELSVVAKAFLEFLHIEGQRLSQQLHELAGDIDPRLKVTNK
ncbi:MAG: LysR family transcriptional regulator [Gammaproteobacteria bacterium SG8_11]|nr:MAG: LysR family transcriptional regulator [Gammaproteobacteria bacterium SG8_11]